jgi:hypothetical protein
MNGELSEAIGEDQGYQITNKYMPGRNDVGAENLLYIFILSFKHTT